MTDDIDRAAEREQELRDDALRDQARRAGLAGKTVADSAAECEDCGEPIPDGRRRAVPGVRLCVACKTRKERLS
jgi:phage/conjugal plasmid C-4 type zinc finger TraR family protein